MVEAILSSGGDSVLVPVAKLREMQAEIECLLAIAPYPAPVERKPLTADDLWRDADLMSLNAELDLPMCQLLRLARAIEQAHGIKAAA